MEAGCGPEPLWTLWRKEKFLIPAGLSQLSLNSETFSNNIVTQFGADYGLAVLASRSIYLQAYKINSAYTLLLVFSSNKCS
jgi:hypothetical protein